MSQRSLCNRLLVCLIGLLVLAAAPVWAQDSDDGLIVGRLLDEVGEPLGFATAGIPTLNLGTTTDIDGFFNLPNVPTGVHELVFSYLGYGDLRVPVTVGADARVEIGDVRMSAEGGINLSEVVVVGQAEGQRAAINQQINANTIVNVVSKERLQELPDQNAAESVGRLAGVSVYRDAGEGQRISVRGISPRLNSVTINGQRLPSTQQNDRSTDLSMISPEMLEGIELYKALTPDRDGDAIGGSVNFTVARARAGLATTVRALGTYNSLGGSANNYRLNASLSDRFGKGDVFGVIATGNYQRIDRSNEALAVGYEFAGLDSSGAARLPIGSLNLTATDETRLRGGGSLTLDFTPSERHSVTFSSTVGTTTRDQLRWRRQLSIANAIQRFDVLEREQSTLLVSNSLNGEHRLGKNLIEWAASYSFSQQDQPEALSARFQEPGATTGRPRSNSIDSIEPVFRNNLANTFLYSTENNLRDIREEHLTAQVDVRRDFRATDKINGFLKAGAKVRRVERGSDATAFILRPYLRVENPAFTDPRRFVRTTGGNIQIANFLGGPQPSDDFLDGRYRLVYGEGDAAFGDDVVDLGLYNRLFGTAYTADTRVAQNTIVDPDRIRSFYNFYRDQYQQDLEADLEDYDGLETVTAAYLMSQVNLGPKLMVVGGVRAERTDQAYTSRIVADLEDDAQELAPDPQVVGANSSYTSVLPMLQAKYQATPWFDVRVAATKTLARPDFFNLVPWIRIDNSEQEIDRGTADLRNTDAWNFDLFASAYNKFGLFTVGAFYKRLENVDYIRSSVLLGLSGPNAVYNGYVVTQPANVPLSTVRGVEFDLQSNLLSLQNRFLKGFVFGANLTVLQSETAYPLLDIQNIPNSTPPPFLITRIIDTLRSGPLVGQADLIANLSVGYEARGFSARLSLNYQGDALSPGGEGGNGVGVRAELDGYDGGFTRMDLSVKQEISRKSGITLVFNANNLLDTPERTFLLGSGRDKLLQEEEFFGATFDIGVFWRFRHSRS